MAKNKHQKLEVNKVSGDRQTEAKNRRILASERAASRPQSIQGNNGEEELKGFPGNFRKGLEHAKDGFLKDDRDYQAYRCAILTGIPENLDHIQTPEPPNGLGRRKWESPSAGFVFDLEGPDAQAIAMPPAPKLDSPELAAEMAEVYAMAALRDIAFANFNSDTNVSDWIGRLNQFSWFSSPYQPRPCREYEVDEIFGIKAGKYLGRGRGEVTVDNLFRGVTTGDEKGPFISQFLLIGNQSLGSNANHKTSGEGCDSPCDWGIQAGKITYGANTIDQRVRIATPGVDFMTESQKWLDVQNGVDVREDFKFDYNPANYQPGNDPTKKEEAKGDPNEPCGPAYRFILTPRDLATYVHFDQLYQAYLNACLIMLGRKVDFDPGFNDKFGRNAVNQEGFAQFGGPHILSLVTEVATRALKAVRYQKFNIHNRTRPETIGGLFEQLRLNAGDERLEPLRKTWEALNSNGVFLNPDNHYLPMAFPEGSPMHPAYGAGHATVAGACVTILKAFFDHEAILVTPGDAYEANPDTEGRTLRKARNSPALTVEEELNKLASNISIGRNMAGVHYFSDYLESIRLGELIAIGILEEQALMFDRLQFPYWMTVPLFDGGTVVIGTT